MKVRVGVVGLGEGWESRHRPALRALADRPRLLWAGSWAVMLFEVIFPITLLHPALLIPALFLAASFHVSNACFFGLNRFVWFWIASYPSILWLQDRLMNGA